MSAISDALIITQRQLRLLTRVPEVLIFFKTFLIDDLDFVRIEKSNLTLDIPKIGPLN